MTATITDTAVLQQLDWAPPCEMRQCEDGHPAATHTCTMRLPCHGFDKLACAHCVNRITVRYAREGLQYIICRIHEACGTCWRRDVFLCRMEPL